jgi:hypothetical protein
MIGELEPPTRNLSGTLPDASDDSLLSKVKEPLCLLRAPTRAGDRGRTGDVQLGKLSWPSRGKGFSAAVQIRDNAILRRWPRIATQEPADLAPFGSPVPKSPIRSRGAVLHWAKAFEGPIYPCRVLQSLVDRRLRPLPREGFIRVGEAGMVRLQAALEHASRSPLVRAALTGRQLPRCR